MNDYKELVENLREEADAVQAMGNAQPAMPEQAILHLVLTTQQKM